jgi:hypothetical protein
MPMKHPPGYTLKIQAGGNFDPADSTDYFIGCSLQQPDTSSSSYYHILIPKSGSINVCQLIMTAGTNGTAENIVMVIRKNNTTDYTFATVGVSSGSRLFANLNLNIPVSAGDYVEIKMTTPAWVTNPLTVQFSGNLYISTSW